MVGMPVHFGNSMAKRATEEKSPRIMSAVVHLFKVVENYDFQNQFAYKVRYKGGYYYSKKTIINFAQKIVLRFYY